MVRLRRNDIEERKSKERKAMAFDTKRKEIEDKDPQDWMKG